MKSKHIITSIAAVALALGLMPLSAFAGESALSSGEISAPTETQAALQTQASGKKTVYVLSKVTGTQSGNSPLVYQYKYNKTGLLVKATRGNFVDNFSYKNTRLIRQATLIANESSTKVVTTLGYDEKGQRVQASWNSGDIFPATTVGTYRYNSGHVVSFSEETTGSDHGYTFTYGNKCKLTYNKKGLVSMDATTSPYQSEKTVRKYAYDKKGNLNKVATVRGGSAETTYKNTYKNGRLAKRVNSGVTYTYTYKAVKVPKQYVSTIKAQQWALLNGNLNLAFARKLHGNHMSYTFGVSS